jgi:hypothetical protein
MPTRSLPPCFTVKRFELKSDPLTFSQDVGSGFALVAGVIFTT